MTFEHCACVRVFNHIFRDTAFRGVRKLYEQISANKWKSALLVFVFVCFVLAVGYVIGRSLAGPDNWYAGLIIAFIIALIMSLISYYQSDRIALAATGARPVGEGEYIRYKNTVEALSIAAGIPMPRIYVIESPAMNAFATGRNPENSAIAVTTGLLERMNNQELEGVIGHEISHIKNYDILLQTLTMVLVGTVIILSDIFIRMIWFSDDSEDSGGAGIILAVIGIILAIIAPILAQMIRLALSRRREYLADASSALLTRYPPGLASALRKLMYENRPLRTASKATAPLFIVEPLFGRKGQRKRASLFDTHPPIEERIRRLEEMYEGFTPITPDSGSTMDWR